MLAVLIALLFILGLPSVTLMCIYMIAKPDIEIERQERMLEIERTRIQIAMLRDDYEEQRYARVLGPAQEKE